MNRCVVHTGTKAQTLMFLREVRKLKSDAADDMSYIEHEDRIDDWCVGLAECRICSVKQTTVFPSSVKSLDDFQCVNCGNMTADIVFMDEEEEDELT